MSYSTLQTVATCLIARARVRVREGSSQACCLTLYSPSAAAAEPRQAKASAAIVATREENMIVVRTVVNGKGVDCQERRVER